MIAEPTLTVTRSKVRRSSKPIMTPVVCIGMSAGGIWPLRTIVEHLSPETGMAFVLVHHLRNVPTRLPQIMTSWTKMPVGLAYDGGLVLPNTIFVLPSGTELRITDDSFMLRPLRKRQGFSNVLTVFLKSLSRSGHPAIAVILSGVDADGAAALKAFRQHGGITIAQDPTTAERPGMPDSAIQTGAVDEVLPPETIALKLENLARRFQGQAE